MLTVTVVAPSRRLTRVDIVEAELGVQLTTDQKQTIARLIDAASSAIEGHCGVASFAREYVTETLAGYDELELNLSRRPVVALNSVSIDSSIVSDVTIAEADDGAIYRRAGWAWSAQNAFSLSGRGTWPAFGHPRAGREEPTISAQYWGGYILPEQWALGLKTLSVSAADNSFNGPAGTFPALLKAGDVVHASGWTNAANNGRFVVATPPAPTTSKIVVSGATLVTEAASDAPRSLAFHPPAQCRSFEGLQRGALITVKAAWLTVADDPKVIERQVGQLRTRRGEGFNEDPTLALPGEALGYIKPWVRSL